MYIAATFATAAVGQRGQQLEQLAVQQSGQLVVQQLEQLVELAEQLVESAKVLADVATGITADVTADITTDVVADITDRTELEAQVKIQQLKELEVLLVAVCCWDSLESYISFGA